MSGRPLPRFSCECAACTARAEDEWDRFVAGHQDAADEMRSAFLHPNGTVTVGERVREYLAVSRQAGETTFTETDGA